ncbi:MAG: DUF2505 domain-containing protein [Propionibacteriaceae bacterium]|nr:DUF2505 domain-containing protein [Propionibacteriaceae bacterium]
MDINTTVVFPADPETVFAMLTNEDFLTEVAEEAGASDIVVFVDGLTSTCKRSLPAPAEAQKFTGAAIKLVEERTWSEAGPDGRRTATLKLTSPGQPMAMPGTIELTPSGDQTTIKFSGDLKVNIPLVGKKLEKMSAPAVVDGVKAEERVGLRWLQK